MVPTRLGALVVTSTARGVAEVELGAGGRRLPTDRTSPLARQLRAYAAGRLRRFRLRLDWQRGTAFQRQVWRTLQTIPYGQTRSYAWVARRVGRPQAVRAVGAACGANPTPILVPCHRVVAADGALGGFSGGLHWKKRLLRLEYGLRASPTDT